jgi:hypothetical protein
VLAFFPMTYQAETNTIIQEATALGERLQRLLTGTGRNFEIRSKREPMALMYWNLAFEHHRGILLLLTNYAPAPAFALLRVLQEAIFKSFLVMFGTDAQVLAVFSGTYQTDFTAVAEQMDKRLEKAPIVQPRMKTILEGMHGFTHGGPQQLRRQFASNDGIVDIISNYSEDEVRGLVLEATIPLFLMVGFTTEFFNLLHESAMAMEMSMTFAESISRIPAGFATIL